MFKLLFDIKDTVLYSTDICFNQFEIKFVFVKNFILFNVHGSFVPQMVISVINHVILLEAIFSFLIQQTFTHQIELKKKNYYILFYGYIFSMYQVVDTMGPFYFLKYFLFCWVQFEFIKYFFSWGFSDRFHKNGLKNTQKILYLLNRRSD